MVQKPLHVMVKWLLSVGRAAKTLYKGIWIGPHSRLWVIRARMGVALWPYNHNVSGT